MLAAVGGTHHTSGPAGATVGDRTVMLTVLAGPQARLVADRVVANTGDAVDAVESFWGADWPRDIVVVAAGTQQQFEAQAGGGPSAQWTDIAAIAVVDRLDPARRTATGQRIVFAPGAADMSDRSFRIVLRHELFHYAARAQTAADAPRWLTEGVADYVARPHPLLPVVAVPPASLPSDVDLDQPGPQRSDAYDRAWWFALFIADTRGAPTLRALYQATCGIGHRDFPVAVRDVLHTDTAGLLADWQRWLTR